MLNVRSRTYLFVYCLGTLCTVLAFFTSILPINSAHFVNPFIMWIYIVNFAQLRQSSTFLLSLLIFNVMWYYYYHLYKLTIMVV